MTRRKFTSDRLSLEVIGESLSEQVVDFYARNKEYLRPWEPKRENEFYTNEYQRVVLREELKRVQDGSLYKVWIFKNDRIIGSIAMDNIVRGAFQSCHVGYKLDQQEQGRGYMTEALRVMIDYAFRELLLHRIEANIMPRNNASLRVVEKLGFVCEGIGRRYLKINGKWEDHQHMVLLNEVLE